METPDLARKPTLLERLRGLLPSGRLAPRVRATSRSRPFHGDEDAIAGAHFSLVGLADLREQLGERWPQLAARVHDLAEAVIRRHLSRGDVFDAHGEDGYVILFTQLTEAQAEFKCRVIAREIAAKLLGADWAGGQATDGLVFELPVAAMSAPSFEAALDEAIARGRPVISAKSASPPRLAPVPQPDDEAPRAPRPAAHALVRLPRDRTTMNYTPVWDFAIGALLHFRFNGPGRAAANETSILSAAKSDLASLNQVLFDAGRLTQAGRRLPVICPVHLETLLREGWHAQVAKMLRSAPAPIRKLVTLEVVAAADSRPDWVRSLEGVWGSLPGRPVGRVSPSGPAVPSMSSNLLRHLNLMLPEDFAATKSGIDMLGSFVQQAERVGMTCGVLGLHARAGALAATAAGFRQLSGPAIHADVASLSQAIRFDLKTLYRDLLPAAS
ncbi:MAG TPA: hypothetical protein VFE13_07520 [Caulobacteraceae bacterium]|nr:hypothetical protein [Caulobacteraceae bacterium]